MRQLFVLIFFLSSTSSFAQSNFDPKILEGLSHTYNLDYKYSDSLFIDYINKHPNDAKGYLYLSQNYLWKFLGTRDEGELGTFLIYNKIAQTKIELLKEDSNYDNSVLLFQEGWSKFLLSMAYSMQDNIYEAFGYVDAAVSDFEEALALDPKFYDPQLGIGLITYSLSYTPSLFKWALPIFGLEGDKEAGFRKIEKAAYGSVFIADEAKYHYARLLAEYKGDFKLSIEVLDNLIAKYPENSLYYYQRAIASIQMDNFKSAKSDLEKVLLINNKFLVQVNALSYFLIGETEYFQRNYESAISSYSKFIETTKSIDYTGIASLRLATANKILEKDSEYQRCIQNASLGNLDIPDDHYASRVSEIILADKLPEQVKFYDYSNRIRSAKSVNEVLAVDLSPFSDKEQIQKLRILKSRKLIEFDELEEADVILENVELTSIKFDADFFPLYYLARAKYFFLLKNINQANYFLEKSIDNNEHFFQTKIEAEINFLAKMFKK